jgi:putative PIN family toxin of toxin-antitoxin system
MTQAVRVVVDPEVFISAAITPTGTCGRLVDRIDDDIVTSISCPHLISEQRHALQRPKLRRYVSPEDAIAYCDTIYARAERHPDPIDVPASTREPGDDYLVALASATGADAIIAGDLDLQKANLPVAVWSPRTAIDLLTDE